jgi:hypothetical protein
MRFSDLMGSGGERDPKQSDNPIDAAIAPYLDDRTETPPPAPIDEDVVEPVEVVAASEPTAPFAPDLPAQPTPTNGPEPAVASFDVAEPIAPAPRAWQPDRPVAPVPPAPAAEVSTAATATATIVADFTPLSDDLLPRRR